MPLTFQVIILRLGDAGVVFAFLDGGAKESIDCLLGGMFVQ